MKTSFYHSTGTSWRCTVRGRNYCPATVFQLAGTTDFAAGPKEHTHMPQIATLERARATKAVREACVKDVFASARGIVENVIRDEYSGMGQIMNWL